MPYFEDVDMTEPVVGITEILNRLRASEIIATQQYYAHAVAVKGPNCVQLADLFKTHAGEETGHAEALMNRIDHLGGELDTEISRLLELTPDGADVRTSHLSEDMLVQDWGGENVAIDAYTEAAALVRDIDPVTWKVLVEILEDEYEHRRELANLLG